MGDGVAADCDNQACPDGGTPKCGGIGATDSTIHTYTMYYITAASKFTICLLLSSFYFFHCSDTVDDCDGVDCENGGKCYDTLTSFKCQCPDTHTGTNCETAITGDCGV